MTDFDARSLLFQHTAASPQEQPAEPAHVTSAAASEVLATPAQVVVPASSAPPVPAAAQAPPPEKAQPMDFEVLFFREKHVFMQTIVLYA